ncbi:hypothetical protein [Ruegeria marina]|uniref:Uncharacterized protein n=1 Tax=Ruegeria marina TaxID=639004 RepID=A0A1G6JUW6_9RHOB|nr:hypothetical protein [Ruegeria marina]SDC22540.1 hypothetical protein SAMN04488239_101445 [Ruegeria marina]
MPKTGDPFDPKGLIYEAYRIEGITASQCRSIFLDWALSLPAAVDQRQALDDLNGRYGGDAPDHPMTGVIRDGLTASATPRRRGGWRSRERN